MVLCGPISALAAAPFDWESSVRVARGGWARMTKLHNGLWLCVNVIYHDPFSLWQIQISADSGRTWHLLGRISQPGRNLDNGQLLQLADGSVLLTGRSVIDDHQPQHGRSYQLPVYRSDDNGGSWTFVRNVDSNVDPPGNPSGLPSVGLWEPFLFLLANGDIACAYSDETRSRDAVPYSQFIGERVSADGGVTWGPETVMVSQTGGGAERPGMPVITHMKNGHYGLIYEVVGIGNADVYFKTSLDGSAWADGIGDPVPGQHAGPYITSLTSGRLVATSCQNVYSYSDDYGITWHQTTPDPYSLGFKLSWPSIYQTGAKEIAAMESVPDVALRFGTIGK